MERDPVYRAKREYIAANNIIVYRFFESWSARQPDPQLGALVRALGREKNYKPAEGVPWATNHASFVPIPPATLRTTAHYVKKDPQNAVHANHRGTRHPGQQGRSLAWHLLLVDLEQYFAAAVLT